MVAFMRIIYLKSSITTNSIVVGHLCNLSTMS